MNLGSYITPEMKLWAFRAYLALRQFTISSWQFGSAVVSATYAALQPNVYVFFDGYELPFKVATLSLETPGIPRPYWYYNASKKLFYKMSPCGETHTFSFLSMSISFNNMNLHSMDDFLAVQHYIGEQPPPLVVVGAWCQANGIILDKKLDFKVQVIHDTGEEKQYGPWSLEWSSAAPLVGNVYIGPKDSAASTKIQPEKKEEEESQVKDTCVAADTFEDDSVAAYPESFENKTEEVVKVVKRVTAVLGAKPFVTPTTFGVVDLSGTEMKID